MRLIDADALKADIEQFNRPLCDDYHMKDYVLNQIITDIENQPTVDAVPVIRCRDCKHRPIGGHAYDHTLVFPDERCPCNCVDDNWYSWMPDDDWYCANAERKKNHAG